jgi:hypothetical protein
VRKIYTVSLISRYVCLVVVSLPTAELKIPATTKLLQAEVARYNQSNFRYLRDDVLSYTLALGALLVHS